MITEIEKFIAWVNDQVINHGLLQISDVHLDRGGTAMDVLRAKATEARIFQDLDKQPSLEEIAKILNDANEDLDQLNYKPYIDDAERTEYQDLWQTAFGGNKTLTTAEVRSKAKEMEIYEVNFLHRNFSLGARGEEVAYIRLIFIDSTEALLTVEEFKELDDVKFKLRPAVDEA